MADTRQRMATLPPLENDPDQREEGLFFERSAAVHAAHIAGVIPAGEEVVYEDPPPSRLTSRRILISVTTLVSAAAFGIIGGMSLSDGCGQRISDPIAHRANKSGGDLNSAPPPKVASVEQVLPSAHMATETVTIPAPVTPVTPVAAPAVVTVITPIVAPMPVAVVASPEPTPAPVVPPVAPPATKMTLTCDVDVVDVTAEGGSLKLSHCEGVPLSPGSKLDLKPEWGDNNTVRFDVQGTRADGKTVICHGTKFTYPDLNVAKLAFQKALLSCSEQ